MDAAALIEEWRSRGAFERALGNDVFVVDVAPDGDTEKPPLLVLHGFPTSCIDYVGVLPALAEHRRVVLLDFPGYGLSSKPDRAYSLFAQADVVEAVVAAHGITGVELLSHDMGDSVAGELLARSLDGDLGFEVHRRVLTNGSIYLAQAHLTDGQQFLCALPDEALTDDTAPNIDALDAALTATLAQPGSPSSRPDPEHVRAAAELVAHNGGNRLLPRLIRYIEERRRHEERWTGAIERHPAPLTIVWGDADPIAVWPMTDELLARRADAHRVRLEGVGHYPMLEAADAYTEGVLSGLS
ncbi:MAG: alpha/beta hydrolase [Acidimicrobiia bacterium]|nr:alpha/beta hydrolase [Acidimicrobiia bacterium]